MNQTGTAPGASSLRPTRIRYGVLGFGVAPAGMPMFPGGIGCLTGGLLLRWMAARRGTRFRRRAIAVSALTADACSTLYVTRTPTSGMAIAAIGFAAFNNELSNA